MAFVGELLRVLFPPALAVSNMGHFNISHDPCRPEQSPALHLLAAYEWNAQYGSDENTRYRSIWQCPDLWESCLLTLAGKVIFGCVRTTSATDLLRSLSAGVAR